VSEGNPAVRAEAFKGERNYIAFMDVTCSVPKSIILPHAAFETQEVNGTGLIVLTSASAR
jgi:hypothetical protein